jgi:hypothetical protein
MRMLGVCRVFSARSSSPPAVGPLLAGAVLWREGHYFAYLLTGVTFVCKVERYARPRPTRTCSGNDPSGPYTRTRHIRIMYEGLMLGRDRHRPHDLAAISPSPNPQPSRARLSASGPQRRPSWPQTGSVAPCAAPALRLRMPQSKDASATVTRPCYLLQVGSSSWSARG